MLVCCCLIPMGSTVQAQIDIPFSQHIETGSRTVFCMMKDADGIIWSGTSLGLLTAAQLVGNNGYTRYPQLNNVIKEVQQDNLQRIWVKTQSNKYMIYTPRTNELIADANAYLRGKGIKVAEDWRASIDVLGKIWIYTGRHIWVYDSKTGFRKEMTLPKSTGQIVGLETDKKGAIIVTQGAIYLSSINNKNLCPRFCAKTDGWQSTEKKLVNRAPDGTIWLYSDARLKSLTPPYRNHWIWHRELQSEATCVLRPNDGEYLMVGTTNMGIYVYDQKGSMVRHIFKNLPMKDGLASNHIECLFYNQENQSLAVAYSKHNLSIFSLKPQQFRDHYVQSKNNMFLLEDVISIGGVDDKSVWLGTEDNGIYCVKTDGSDEILENRNMKSAATAVFKDSEGNLWTGLYHKGLFCSDGRMFFPGSSPYHIWEKSPTRFFVVTNGEGLWVLNPKTGEKRQIPMENYWLMDMAVVADKVYTATPKFLYCVDANTLLVQKIPGSKFLNSDFKDGNKVMLADRRGWIWLVNYKGHSPVDIYDTKNNRTFQCKELKAYDVYSLAEDVHGHIWCATDQGMVLVKVREKGGFDTYCFGKQRNTLYNFRALRSVGNLLVIGHTQGFHLVNPDVLESSIAHARPSGRLIPSALRINEEYIAPGMQVNGKVLLSSDLAYLQHLDLAYDQNNLMIECHPKTFVTNERTTYCYWLQGMEGDWLPIDNNVITLSNLPAGKYRLIVRESDVNKRDLGEYELLSITIHPPFWATVWAYLLYFMLLVAMVFFVVKYYQNRRKYRNQINELMLKAEMEAGITPTKVEPVTNDEKLIADAVKVVEENMSDPNFSVEELSEKLNMHRTNLYKKLQFLTGKTPTQFIRLMRMKRGKQLLSKGNILVSQVAYEVGFNDPKKFARYFKEEFGMYPSEYSKQQAGKGE